ncbi:CotD family spore coat protein [Peribacillus butanolivorans]|uniref:CotD family spore coat protein n=2 Tax=Bacillaceae TaxID=186817 RepID=UPI003672F82D
MTYKIRIGGFEMYNRTWANAHNGQCPPQYCPPQTFPIQHSPPQISPTKQFVKTNVTNTVIPVVHPTHTTIVNKHVKKYIHHSPNNVSVVNECYTQRFVCGVPQPPYCPRRPFRY